MNCLDFQAWLQNYLDGAEGSSSEVDGHLATCGDCRAQHAAAGLILSWPKAVRPPTPPSDLAARIAGAVLADRVERRRRFRIHIRTTIALAASLLLVFLAANFWLPGQRDRGNGLVVQQVNHLPPLPEQAPMPLAQTMDQAGKSVAALTGRLADKTKEHAWHMLAAAVPAELTQDAVPVEPLDPAASLLHMGAQVSENLQPLTRSAQRAVQRLFRDLAALDVSSNNQ